MKECRRCKITQLEDQFPKRKSNLDGLYSYCKECCRKENKIRHEKNKTAHNEKCKAYREENRIFLNQKSCEYYYKNREKVLKKSEIYRKENKEKISLREAFKRISDEERFEKNRQKHLAWSKDNRDRINEYQREWYQKNKEKRKAHVILRRAIISGKIMRPETCSECHKEVKPDGHHEDYSKPLEVVWICRACHSRKSPRTVLV